MADVAPGIRRLCVAVSPTLVTEANAALARSRVHEALARICCRAELERVVWTVAPDRPGQLGLFPPGIDEPRLLVSFLHALANVVAEMNVEAGARTRLVAAAHEGVARLHRGRFVGHALNQLWDLLDAPSVEVTLRQCENADFAAVISDRVLNEPADIADLVDLGGRLDRVDVAQHSPGPPGNAWLYLPRTAHAG